MPAATPGSTIAPINSKSPVVKTVRLREPIFLGGVTLNDAIQNDGRPFTITASVEKQIVTVAWRTVKGQSEKAILPFSSTLVILYQPEAES